MGFFSKIFGGKKETGELQTGSGEQPAVEDSQPHKVVKEAEPIPEEDRVPEPEPQPEPKGKGGADHKPTVFGMAAPSFTSKSEPAPVSGEVSSDEMAAGEMAAGEMVIDGGNGEPARSEAAGSVVVGGEVTLGQTNSGEIVMDEVSVAAPIVRSEPAEEPAAEAAPVVPAAASESGPVARTSGARPAILDDDEHSDLDLFPKAAEKQDSRSSIECGSCHHKLPVPYVGYPARITCPFCLNVNEYNM